jgi:hypothetical protein
LHGQFKIPVVVPFGKSDWCGISPAIDGFTKEKPDGLFGGRGILKVSHRVLVESPMKNGVGSPGAYRAGMEGVQSLKLPFSLHR